MPTNPFSQPSVLPFQAPPFDKISTNDYRSALEEGMRQKREEVHRIADNPDAPTFENTYQALELCGQMLRRVENVFSAMTAANSSEALQALDEEMARTDRAGRRYHVECQTVRPPEHGLAATR